MSGAGYKMTPDLDWGTALTEWRIEVADAMRALQQGDVQLNGALAAKDSRQFGLLSRVRELQHA